MKFLGKRIKIRREETGLHLTELSKLIGISPSALSQIENGKAFPSVLTLKTIADNLHTSVSELIGEHEALSSSPLIKYGDKQFAERNASGTSVFLVTGHIRRKHMDSRVLIFPEGGDSNNILDMHHGQTYLFLIKGELAFTLDNETYVLKKNDSVYFNAIVSHSAINKSHREAHLLVVSTPPF